MPKISQNRKLATGQPSESSNRSGVYQNKENSISKYEKCGPGIKDRADEMQEEDDNKRFSRGGDRD